MLVRRRSSIHLCFLFTISFREDEKSQGKSEICSLFPVRISFFWVLLHTGASLVAPGQSSFGPVYFRQGGAYSLCYNPTGGDTWIEQVGQGLLVNVLGMPYESVRVVGTRRRYHIVLPRIFAHDCREYIKVTRVHVVICVFSNLLHLIDHTFRPLQHSVPSRRKCSSGSFGCAF